VKERLTVSGEFGVQPQFTKFPDNEERDRHVLDVTRCFANDPRVQVLTNPYQAPDAKSLPQPGSTAESYVRASVGRFRPLKPHEVTEQAVLLDEGARLYKGRGSLENLSEDETAVMVGATAAYQILINTNLRLIIREAKADGFLGGVGSLHTEDIIQAGLPGLSIAVRRFDTTRGKAFSTFAIPWIKHSMRRSIENESRTMRLPSHLARYERRTKAARDELRQKLRKEPSTQEISDNSGVDIGTIIDFGTKGQRPASLNKPVGEDGAELGDIMADPALNGSRSPYDQAIERLRLSQILERAGLRPMERRVVWLRHELDGENEPGKTDVDPNKDEIPFRVIGEELGISVSRANSIYKGALAKLRNAA